MNDTPQRERQEALIVILLALLLVGLSWFALGRRGPSTPQPTQPKTTVQP
jgi:hypothetical protein